MTATIWNGNGAAPSSTKGWTPILITAVTAGNVSTPAEITATGHGCNTGDTVEVFGTGQAGIDGVNQITKIDANHFYLNGTQSEGSTGAVTAYAFNYEIQPAFQFPSDGTLADANDVVALGEGLSNAIPYLYRRAGKWSTKGIYQVVLNSSFAPIGTAWSTNSITSTTFADLANTTTSTTAFGNGAYAPVVTTTDWLDITWTGSIEVYNTTSLQTLFTGIAGALGGGTRIIPTGQGAQFPSILLSSGPLIVPFTLRAWGLASYFGASSAGTLSLSIQAAKSVSGDGTDTVGLFGPSSLLVNHYGYNV
jgi:hypothetical protein